MAPRNKSATPNPGLTTTSKDHRKRVQTAKLAPDNSNTRTTRARSASIIKSASKSSSTVLRTTRSRSTGMAKSNEQKLIPTVNVSSFRRPTIASLNKSCPKAGNPKLVSTGKDIEAVTKKKALASSGPPNAIPPNKSNPHHTSRSAVESKLMKEHADHLLKNGLIDEETASKLSVPWHEKGVLDMQWDSKYLDSSRRDNVEIMDLKKAQQKADKKDRQEKKWLEDWRAGSIDEHGNTIGEGVIAKKEVSFSVEKSKTEKKEEAAEGKEKFLKKEPVKKVLSGRISKSAPVPKRTPLPTIPETSSPALLPQPASNPKPKAPAKSKSKRSSKPTDFIVPENGAENYEQFDYYKLAALGRARDLPTGGNVWALRERLIEDDKHIRDGTERGLTSYSRSRARGFKTEAPILENKVEQTKGKRKRETGDEDEDEGEVETKKQKK